MGIFLSSTSTSMAYKDDKLTQDQRRMYAAETFENFRWISKIIATYSPYTLTAADHAPATLDQTLAELGQFAEVAYSAIPIEFLLKHSTLLRQPGYPLETYDALHDAVLVDSFQGGLPIFITYRPLLGQLVVAISGTSSVKHALHDLRVFKCSHPSGRGNVHTGFWTLYQDIKAQAITGIQKGFADYSVKELVLTGHSMGGSVAYLLCLDLLADHQIWLKNPNTSIKVATFGSPRTGDATLVKYFQELSLSYQKAHVQGQDGFKEYSVKGYNDGVPALPPTRLGYRHFCREPLYSAGGTLYNIPATESEHSLFHIVDQSGDGPFSLFPRGGHNYYNGRDLEKFIRRLKWLIDSKPMEDGWEDRYTAIGFKLK